MTRTRRTTRPLAALALWAALGLGFAQRPAIAQEPEPEPEAGSGRSLDGYFATGALAGLAMFLVCKSARRS